jgi:hypothetical protein
MAVITFAFNHPQHPTIMAGDDNEASTAEENEVRPSPSPCSPLLTAPQRLKAALWYSIGQIVDDESLRTSTNATPQYIGALTELAWSQLGRPPCRLIRVEANTAMKSPSRRTSRPLRSMPGGRRSIQTTSCC